ncbi:MAG: histidine--tRNA ligase [Candidatus Dojkabacteria bacterium]|nr:MAG: histidine--tRNA ligase [Candidatus Dojkabacteria bacterium]
MKTVSTQPYKGARDFYPEDMRLRNYIFDKWRKVSRLFGFEEYDFPIVEPFEVFASKSGEEIVNTQLFSFTDRGDRKLALRPELTPSTVRMIAGKFNEIPRPIKWFMIGNNWRFEKPQKGRGREFYQLEANIFGVSQVEADFEIISLIVALMKEFGATSEMFSIRLSDRRLISALLNDTLQLSEEKQLSTRRLMDKYRKMSPQEFTEALYDIDVDAEKASKIAIFMDSGTKVQDLTKSIPQAILEANEGYISLLSLFTMLENAGIAEFCQFDPGIIRGFDYSDGLVYEAFDNNPEYKRSLFGGERFDKLVQVYGNYDLAATGFAVSDVSLLEFLKGWNLVPELPQTVKVLVALFENGLNDSQKVAAELRNAGISTDMFVQYEKLDKQIKYADKKGIEWMVIPGEEELKAGKVVLKNLRNRTQEVVSVKDVISALI